MIWALVSKINPKAPNQLWELVGSFWIYLRNNYSDYLVLADKTSNFQRQERSETMRMTERQMTERIKVDFKTGDKENTGARYIY